MMQNSKDMMSRQYDEYMEGRFDLYETNRG